MNDPNLNLSEPLPEMFDRNESLKSINLGAATSSFFLTADLITLVPMVYLYYLLILMIRREDKKKRNILLKNLLLCNAAIIPTGFFIALIYTNIILRYTYPPSVVLGDWSCVAFQLVGGFFATYAGGFSLCTAISKFWFIVCSNKARKFGEERAKTIILLSHLMIPTIASMLSAVSSGNKDQMFWLDICWGQKQETEHMSGQINQWGLEMFCYNRQYEIASYFNEKTTKILESVLRVMCGGLKIFHIFFVSNIVELFLYIFIFRCLNR